MTKVCPIPTRAQSSHTLFIHQHLNSTKFVFVRHDGVKSSLQLPYNGPFKVIDCDDKYFTIEIRGKQDTICIGRLKPTYMEAELTATNSTNTDTLQDTNANIDRSNSSIDHTNTTPSTPVTMYPNFSSTTTRYGRHVRPSVKFQLYPFVT